MKPSLSISTCWNSHRHQDGAELLQELADMGFTHVELGHGIRFSLWPGILDACQRGVMKVSSLHNFCPLPIGFNRANPNCYEFSDSRPGRYRSALKYSIETINNAAELGAGAVVLHLGSLGMPDYTEKLEHFVAKGALTSKKFTRLKIGALADYEKRAAERWPRIRDAVLQLAEHAQKRSVRLGLECRECIEEFPVDSFWDEIFPLMPPHVGYWHDFGHAARKHAIGWIRHEEHFRHRAPRLIGCHIHDFQMPARDHCAPGDGILDYPTFWRHLPEPFPIFVLELSPRIGKERVLACLEWWNKTGPEVPVSPGA